MVERIWCGQCHQQFRLRDKVFLDIHNSMLHKSCHKPSIEIKDEGSFKDIVNRYDFFEDFITKKIPVDAQGYQSRCAISRDDQTSKCQSANVWHFDIY